MTVIRTSSWFSPLPPDHVRIGISRGSPRGLRAGSYRRYPKLNPGPWFSSASTAEFCRLYYAEVLDRLDPEKVVRELTTMCDGGVPVLACFEKPPPDVSWCHRALVSAWLHDTLGLEVCEVGHEEEGFGWRHPKLHPSLHTRPEERTPPQVADRSAEITPHIGKLFRYGKKIYQVKGPSREFPDQVVVSDGKRELTITVETMLAKLDVDT